MKALKKVLREDTIIDEQTGEIIKRETTFEFSKEPAYVKLYFDCLGIYINNEGLTSSLNDLLVEVLKRSTYAEEGQIVYLNKFTNLQISRATGKSVARIKQAIRIWINNNILIRVARGVYQVNPYIFGKGEWKNIANLRATFDFVNGKVNVERGYGKCENIESNDGTDTSSETSQAL